MILDQSVNILLMVLVLMMLKQNIPRKIELQHHASLTPFLSVMKKRMSVVTVPKKKVKSKV